jgi:hypothetical protein
MGLRRWNKETERWENFGSPQVNPATIGAAALTHSSSHAIGGADPLAPSAIGAVSATSGQVTTAPTNSTVVRNITTSTSAPAGGIDGDVWLKYV